MSRTVIRVPSFFSQAPALRQSFDNRFGSPEVTTSERFVWDYWNLPDQYTVLRTPAYEIFPEKIYRKFHETLVNWGRKNLGCHDISPPWLSCYVEGCEQRTHQDQPHGPWAFVYSLTPWSRRKFQGGETFLWQSEFGGQNREARRMIEKIPPLFNQLLVFDPNVPHGVERVRGVNDVCEGRLVIHGWFVEPRPFVEGAINRHELQSAIDEFLSALETELGPNKVLGGLVIFRIKVNPSGKVGRVDLLNQRLETENSRMKADLLRWMKTYWSRYLYPSHSKESTITLPVIFSSDPE